MVDLQPHDIFQIELLDCTRADDFYAAGAKYFEVEGPTLWDIYAVMSNYELKDRLTYVENHVFLNDLIKQDMVMYWFDALSQAHPTHQVLEDLY
jgi:hypothetical protein